MFIGWWWWMLAMWWWWCGRCWSSCCCSCWCCNWIARWGWLWGCCCWRWLWWSSWCCWCMMCCCWCCWWCWWCSWCWWCGGRSCWCISMVIPSRSSASSSTWGWLASWAWWLWWSWWRLWSVCCSCWWWWSDSEEEWVSRFDWAVASMSATSRGGEDDANCWLDEGGWECVVVCWTSTDLMSVTSSRQSDGAVYLFG